MTLLRNRVMQDIERWRDLQRDEPEEAGPQPRFPAVQVLGFVREAVSTISEVVARVEEVLDQHVTEGEHEQLAPVREQLDLLVAAALEADHTVVQQAIAARRRPRTRTDREARQLQRDAIGWGAKHRCGRKNACLGCPDCQPGQPLPGRGLTPEEREARIRAGRCPDCGSDSGHYSGCERELRKHLS